jgi:acyl-CoA synthetase (AMP-forming)/AMP-acid ligase II
MIIIGGRNYYPQDIEATAKAIDAKIRPGCSAAFTIDPISGLVGMNKLLSSWNLS